MSDHVTAMIFWMPYRGKQLLWFYTEYDISLINKSTDVINPLVNGYIIIFYL